MVNNLELQELLKLAQEDFNRAKERLLDLQKQDLEIELHNLMLSLDEDNTIYDIELGSYDGFEDYYSDYVLNGNSDKALMDITPINIIEALIQYWRYMDTSFMASVRFTKNDFDVVFWIQYNGYNLYYDYV